MSSTTEALQIGTAIRKRRLDLGYKQNAFSKKVGIANVTLSDIENNKQYPHGKTLLKICEHLNLDISHLVLSTLKPVMLSSLYREKYEYHFNHLMKILNNSICDGNEVLLQEFIDFKDFAGNIINLVKPKAEKFTASYHEEKSKIINEAWRSNCMMPIEIIDLRNFKLAGQKYSLPDGYHSDALQYFICEQIYHIHLESLTQF